MRFRLKTASGSSITVQDGVIAPDDAAVDFELDVGHAELRPGLINAHDHLHRNHYGRLGHPPYQNSYDWGADIHARDADAIGEARAVPRRTALLYGALKNLIAGVTTVVHHDAWESDFERDFPMRVARVPQLHSPGLSALELNQLPVAAPLWIHLAEGVDAIAATEVEQLDRMGLLSPNLVAIHVVGPDAAGIERLCASAPGIVWCPTSNLFLFGVTAPRELLERCGEVMLGSDSLLTADGTLLDELRIARQLGVLSDHALTEAVSEVPARRLGLPAPTLDVGAAADIIALRKPLLAATADDVALVLVAGVPRSADAHCADIFAQCSVSADDVEWRGVRRKVSVELAHAQRSVDKSRASRTSSTRISSA